MGDLAQFRSTAEALAELDPAHNLAPDLILQLGPLRWEARAGAGARSTVAAARASAEIGRTCGECHVANDAGLGDRFVVGEAPAGGSAGRHMAGLAWVSRLLWDGLVGPSEETWSAGARALAEAGTLPEGLASSVPVRDVDLASERLRRLASEAAAARETPDRVRVLAQIWATCANCHVGGDG